MKKVAVQINGEHATTILVKDGLTDDQLKAEVIFQASYAQGITPSPGNNKPVLSWKMRDRGIQDVVIKSDQLVNIRVLGQTHSYPKDD